MKSRKINSVINVAGLALTGCCPLGRPESPACIRLIEGLTNRTGKVGTAGTLGANICMYVLSDVHTGLIIGAQLFSLPKVKLERADEA